jgi:glycosyltransferase involved in cell wall biosynthesis
MFVSPHQYPFVTIGVPSFNSYETILTTLDSLSRQDYPNLKVVVSDDCSNDGSQKLIEDFVRTRENFSVIRQNQNLGLYQNLKFLADFCSDPYFMWCASDDFLSENFVSKNVKFLEENLDYVSSSSSPIYLYPDFEFPGPHIELSGGLSERLCEFALRANWSHNIFYSLTRTSAVKEFAKLGQVFPAADWAYDIHLILRGKINTSEAGFIKFGTSGVSRSRNANRKFTASTVDRILPFFSLTLYL